MADNPAHLPADRAVTVINPEDDVTAESFNTWLEGRQAGDPVDPGVRAEETLAEVRGAGEV